MRRRSLRTAGFTLVELIMTMAIAAILAAIALPAYQSSVRKAARQVATRSLIELSAKQEALRSGPSRSFAATFEPLVDIDATTVFVDRDGRYAAAVTAQSIYRLEIDNVVTVGGRNTAYRLTVEAIGTQAKDKDCEKFSLTSAGVRSASGSASDPVRQCWSA